MNARYEIISGFRRIGEAEAWAVAHNRRIIAELQHGCDDCQPDKALFCFVHQKAHARMDERIEDDHVITYPVVCVES